MRQCMFCNASIDGAHHNRKVCLSPKCQEDLESRRKFQLKMAGEKHKTKSTKPSGRVCRKCGKPVPANGRYWQLCSEQCRLNETRTTGRVDGDYIYNPKEVAFSIADLCGI